MARTRPTLALCLLMAAPFGVGTALAEPAGTPERPAATAPAGTSTTDTSTTTPGSTSTSPNPSAVGVQRDIAVPATPVPMNLPDEAKQSEVRGEMGIGVAGLVLGALLVVGVVVGGLFFLTRRSWSAQH